MLKLKAIIWDLDGTLIHFKIDFIKARRNAINILKGHAIPKKLFTIKRSILENVSKAKEHLEQRGTSKDEIRKILKEVDAEVIRIEYDAAQKATMLEGIDKVLEFAKQNGLKQAIYTFNTNHNAKTSLEAAGLLEFIDFVAGRDDVKHPKPHPDHLNFICDTLHVTPSEIIVVGDTHRDIEGAKNIGALSIAINTKISGYIKEEGFKSADYFIEEHEIPSKLIEILSKLL